jgi:eukaryotic-like serine/threonine-protein kinase
MSGQDMGLSWVRLRTAFDEIVALGDAARAVRLDEIRAANPPLRAELDEMLAADASSEDRLAGIDRVFATRDPGTDDPLGLAGRMVGHFSVIALLAAGGMGVVYRAHDADLDRTVALKFPLPHHRPDAGSVERFRREARAAAALDHPNICSVYETGQTADGQLFLAMALYEGETLKARFARDGSLGVREALDVAARIVSGLGAAHRAGIVHRDLKPANVMLLPDGGVKILDFGLARMPDGALTTSRGTPGTIAYMAPELIRGETSDARADLWAFGVLLYEMLAGERPFKGGHEVALMHAILNNEPVRPSLLRPAVEPWLEGLVLSLLAKEPAARPHSTDRVLDALTMGAGGPAPAPAPARPAGRRRLHVGAIVALLVSLLWAGVWLARGELVANTEPHVVAVLPFTYTGADPDIGAAVADAVSNRLSRLSRVAVPDELTTAAYVLAGSDAADAARELSADGLVTGTIAEAGGAVRIDVAIYDARRDRMTTRSYTVPRNQVHATLPRLLRDVASGLRLGLPREDRRRIAVAPTSSPEAWDLYLRGRAMQLRDAPLGIVNTSAESMQQAQSYFVMARELDPDFALARARLAQMHLQIAQKYDTTSARLDQTRLEAEAALRLDPDLPEAHIALAFFYRMGNDHARAAAQLQLAVDAAPFRSDLRLPLAYRLRDLGQWEEAAAQLETAVGLDPRNTTALMQAGLTYGRMRRYDHGIAAWDRMIALQPDNPLPKLFRGLQYQRLGIIDSLASTLERMPPEHDDGGMATWARYTVLRAQRRHADVLAMLDSARHGISQDGLTYRPIALMRAVTLDEMGDREQARRGYDAARRLLEDSVRAKPRDPSIRIGLGLAYAGLGRNQDAVREARTAMELMPLAHSKSLATAFMGGAVEVYLKVGDHGEAIRLIELLLAMPAGREVSVPLLRMDPMFDPLRGDPRFEQLLVRFSRS